MREVSTNLQVGSILISFNPLMLGQSQLLQILEESGISQGKALSSDTFGQTWTRIQSLIPSLDGILVTRWIGVQGWLTIPAYLVCASTIRQVMEQVELGLPEAIAAKITQKTEGQLNQNVTLVAASEEEKMLFRVIIRFLEGFAFTFLKSSRMKIMPSDFSA